MSKLKIVDDIGELKAQIAPLEEKLKKLQAKLAEKGKGAYEGYKYDASVSIFDRTKYNMDAIREKLSPQFLSANSSQYSVTVVKTVAKRREQPVPQAQPSAEASAG